MQKYFRQNFALSFMQDTLSIICQCLQVVGFHAMISWVQKPLEHKDLMNCDQQQLLLLHLCKFKLWFTFFKCL